MAEAVNSSTAAGKSSGKCGANTEYLRPRGGRLLVRVTTPTREFDGAKWWHDWHGFGSIGHRDGRLLLVFSRRHRSPERLRLLRELRASRGAAAVMREVDRRRNEWNRRIAALNEGWAA